EGNSTFARDCARCGAPNPARPAALAIGGALAALGLAALVTGAVIVFKPSGRPATPASAPAAKPQPNSAFAWLQAALDSCDADAANDKSTLQFLVIPLAASKADDEEWRKKSLNDIGNGVLLKSDDALAGLGDRQLKLSSIEYVFAIRDDATGVVYKWKPGT